MKFDQFTIKLLFITLILSIAPGIAFSQVAFANGFNTTTSAANVTTVGAGSNRMLVYIIGYEDDDNGNDVTSVTYGGQAMTLAVQVTTFVGAGSQNRVEIWYLNEAGITAATHTTFTPVFSISNPSTSHGYYTAAVTLSSVNQSTPICSTSTGIRVTSSTVSLTTGMSVLPSELVIYATSGGDSRTHSPNSGYTETVDLNGAGGGQGFSVGRKLISTAATENLTVTASGNHNRFVMAAVRFIPPLASCTSALPIELLGFNGEVQNKEVILRWQTASEINNDKFIIERSVDFVNWNEVATVSGSGNSRRVMKYSCIDQYPVKGLAYYRIKQMDFDQTSSLSNAIAIDFLNKEMKILRVFPNPASNELVIEGSNLNVSQLQVSNILGQDITQNVMIDKTDEGKVKFNLTDLQKGIYFIRTENSFTKFIKE